jgi:hypothetical protein
MGRFNGRVFHLEFYTEAKSVFTTPESIVTEDAGFQDPISEQDTRICWHGSWRYLQLTFRLFRVPHTHAEHPLLQHAPGHVLQHLPHTQIAENLCRIISLAPSQGKVVYTFSTAQDRVEFVSTVEHFNGLPHTSLREPSSTKYFTASSAIA